MRSVARAQVHETPRMDVPNAERWAACLQHARAGCGDCFLWLAGTGVCRCPQEVLQGVALGMRKTSEDE